MVLPCLCDLKTSRLCSPRWFLNIHAVWSHSAQHILCQEYHGQILWTFLESKCAFTYTTAMAQWQFLYSRMSLYTQLLLRKIKHSYTQPLPNSKLVSKILCSTIHLHPLRTTATNFIYTCLHCTKRKAKKNKKNHSNKSVLLLMCWCDITAAERGSRKPFIWAGKCVRVSDRQHFPGVPKQ